MAKSIDECWKELEDTAYGKATPNSLESLIAPMMASEKKSKAKTLYVMDDYEGKKKYPRKRRKQIKSKKGLLFLEILIFLLTCEFKCKQTRMSREPFQKITYLTITNTTLINNIREISSSKKACMILLTV